MDKIFKQLYPGVKEEYLERAIEKLKKNGCPADEDLMVWFGKLVMAECKNRSASPACTVE